MASTLSIKSSLENLVKVNLTRDTIREIVYIVIVVHTQEQTV